MIVRHFLSWVRNASADERADATRALARAWLISDFCEDDRIAAEGALLMMLDDRAAVVRQALSEVFAASADAPPAIIRALVADHPAIALPVAERSPVLLDADLVDLVATGSADMQSAIARRFYVSAATAAAIAEVADAAACLELLENPNAELPVFSIDRLVERHGHLAAIRECLLARDDLSLQTRLALADKLSGALSHFVTGMQWMSAGQAREVAAEARERSLVDVAAHAPEAQLRGLVQHLRQTAELTPSVLLRALLCGNEAFFEVSLVELSGLSPRRVASLLADCGRLSRAALLERAGFPRSTFTAFHAALDALAQIGAAWPIEDATYLRRPLVEQVLMACENESPGTIVPVVSLLRRFATEAARDEARLFCQDIVAQTDAAVADAASAALENLALFEEARVENDLVEDNFVEDDLIEDHLVLAEDRPNLQDLAAQVFAGLDLADDLVSENVIESGLSDDVVQDELADSVFGDHAFLDAFLSQQFVEEDFTHNDYDNDESSAGWNDIDAIVAEAAKDRRVAA